MTRWVVPTGLTREQWKLLYALPDMVEKMPPDCSMETLEHILHTTLKIIEDKKNASTHKTLEQ